MKTRIINVMLVLLVFAANINGQNLLKNGGFESSSPNGTFPSTGWQKSWYPAEAGALCTSTAAMEGRSGLWMYTTTGRESNSKPYQEVKCTPLTKYHAEAYLRCPSGESWTTGTTAYISIAFKNSSGVTIKTVNSDKKMSGSNEWEKYAVSFIAPERSVKVRFTVNLTSNKGQSICNVDNCSLVTVND